MSTPTTTLTAQNTAANDDPWAAVADTPAKDSASPWGDAAAAMPAATDTAAPAAANDDPWQAVGNASDNTEWLNGPDAVAQAAQSAASAADATQAAQPIADSGFQLHQL